MDASDILQLIGAIILLILLMIIVIAIIVSPFIVAMIVADYFKLTGIAYCGVVVTLYMFIMAIFYRLRN